jgi:prepilin signal peptidase PulO-like enzyme (type II secretory pathway)
MPGMPLAGGWLAPVILILLGAAAFIDARNGRIPDTVILVGLLLTSMVEGCLVNWPFAGRHLLAAFAAGMLLYGINEIWYRAKKNDAIGMGDAKWTMLAIDCFTLKPVLIAWGLGACLALLWMGLARVLKRRLARVYFAPFLWVGLLVGIYWWRWR